MINKVLKKSMVCLALLATMSYGTTALAAPSAPAVTKNATRVQTEPAMAKAFDPVAPAQPEGHVVNYTLEAKRAKLEIGGKVREV